MYQQMYLQCVCVPHCSEVIHGFSGSLLVHVQLLAQSLQAPTDRTFVHPPRIRIRRFVSPHS